MEIYLPSKYSITKAPLLKNTLNEYELNVIKVAKEGMFIEKGKVFLAVNEGLRIGEILQIGDIPMKYKIIGKVKFTKKGNRCYRIKRIDNTLIQGLDISNAKEGTKVFVTSRKTDMDYVNLILQA